MRYALATVALAALLVGCQDLGLKDEGAEQAPARRAWGDPKPWFSLADGRIRESSGVAPSRRTDDRFYTHNDSGDPARFFAFGTDGKVSAEYRVKNAQAQDWEDMASAEVGGKPYLFFGDIGDNPKRRKHVVFYRVPEPSGPGGDVQADAVLTLTYPQGPENAEALLIHPKTGEVTIVAKTGDGPSGVYQGPAADRTRDAKLTRVGQIEVGGSFREARLVTGGDWSPDGRYVVLRTYLGAYEYPVPSDGRWWTQTPSRVKTNLEVQGEAITYTRDGKALVTTSEGTPCPVSRIPLGG